MRFLSLQHCLGIPKVDRLYHISAGDINPSTGKAFAINPSSGVWDDNYFASNFGNNQGGGGTPRLDFVSGLTDQLVQSDQTNKAAVNTAQNSLIDYYKNLPSSVDLFSKFNDQYGITQQQQLVDSLTKDIMQQQDLYQRTPADVTARSGDFVVNQADKDAITAREQKPILDNLNSLMRN